MLDQFAAVKDEEAVAPAAPLGVIGIRGTAFTWSNESAGTVTPGPERRRFTLRIEDELIFKRGHFNLIVGPTGSGKTSLLMALLGTMSRSPQCTGMRPLTSLQVKCTASRSVPTRMLVSLATGVWHMLLKNPGYRMKPSGQVGFQEEYIDSDSLCAIYFRTIFSLEAHMTRIVTKRVS